MSFFRKLKDRLFKSSSKIDEGVEALLEEGDVTEEVAAPPPQASEPEVEEPPAPAADAAPETPAQPEPSARQPEP
ncbi:MAG: signal recognition particle-docking protein FtsY, partial [Pseudomonadota bacterium]